MNPDETNPTTNTGTTGGSNAGSVVPPALDFTSSETTSLSMADSLASAADNLTSAGMAAKEPDTGSIEMDQIGASDPSAQMERPDEPLVPAAPVPGSIGSVTSGPAVVHGDANTAPTSGASGFGTPGVGVSSASGASSFGAPSASGLGTTPGVSGFGSTASNFGATSGHGFGASTSSTTGTPSASTGMGGMPSTTGVGASGAGVASAGSAGNNVAGEPYNPFAAKMGASAGTSGAQASSMNVPTGSQPATEKFSAKLPSATAKKPSMLTVILGILAVVSLVMAIVFAVLWQQAEANQKVVYEPAGPSDGAANQTVAMMTCTKNFGPDEIDVMPGLVDHNAAATVSFSNDQLGSITMLNKYAFADAEAAEAMRTYFDGTVVWYGSVAEASGVTAGPASLDIAGTVATLSLSTTPEQLAGEYVALFGLTAGEDGKVDTSRENIQANYAANGYVCVED